MKALNLVLLGDKNQSFSKTKKKKETFDQNSQTEVDFITFEKKEEGIKEITQNTRISFDGIVLFFDIEDWISFSSLENTISQLLFKSDLIRRFFSNPHSTKNNNNNNEPSMMMSQQPEDDGNNFDEERKFRTHFFSTTHFQFFLKYFPIYIIGINSTPEKHDDDDDDEDDDDDDDLQLMKSRLVSKKEVVDFCLNILGKIRNVYFEVHENDEEEGETTIKEILNDIFTKQKLFQNLIKNELKTTNNKKKNKKKKRKGKGFRTLFNVKRFIKEKIGNCFLLNPPENINNNKANKEEEEQQQQIILYQHPKRKQKQKEEEEED